MNTVALLPVRIAMQNQHTEATVVTKPDRRLRKLLAIPVAVVATCTLASCQTNSAGRAGYVPTICSAPGSSCSLDPPALSEAARR